MTTPPIDRLRCKSNVCGSEHYALRRSADKAGGASAGSIRDTAA